MTQEEKELLLKDLCARLPYHGLICQTNKGKGTLISVECSFGEDLVYVDFGYSEAEEFDLNEDDGVKPYLRPMSSMIQEERDEIEEMSHGWFYVNEDGEIFPVGQLTDSGEFEDAILPTLEWLNKKMFDYRGLIPMGLALEAPEDMYKTE